MENKKIYETIKLTKVIPVLTIQNEEDAIPLSRALLAGGINLAEITFRTAAAPNALKAISKNVPKITIGAGTVLTVEQAKEAILCGASFLISPGFSKEVADFCKQKHITYIPGVATSTEIMAATSSDINVLKLFPCELLGGTKYLDAIKGPFPNIQFIPTGGIKKDNAQEYLQKSNVLAIGASWVCSKENIAKKDWEAITKIAQEIAKM